MKIGVIGQGFVGNAVYQKFKNYYDIKTYDLDSSKCNSTEQETLNNEIVFVCLPTPMNKDGSCNTDIVEGAVKRCFEFGITKTIIIKSTVSPGTTARLNSLYPSVDIVFNPEFLTEANAVNDYENQTRIILGGPRKANTILKPIFKKAFPKASIIKTDSTYAEMVKYLANCFLSLKVSFANEMYQLCQALEIDYDKIIEYSSYDDRLGTTHWAVPGPDGDFGYGGHCFPKDMAALIHLTEQLGTLNNTLKAAEVTNDKVRKNKDWLNMKGRAIV